jgi:hypothetical protein
MAFKLPTNNPDGLETTDRQGGVVAADPNSENVSEWIVRKADGRLVYLTPLTRTGSARAVVAYLEVDADRVATGEAPTARLVELAAPVASPQDVASGSPRSTTRTSPGTPPTRAATRTRSASTR